MAKQETSINYRLLSEELETILNSLQSAELDIDESLKCYERGVAIIKQLEACLQTAENKVAKIKQQSSDRA